MKNGEVFKFLRDTKRLGKPENCPEKFYYIMLRCWLSDASKRPSFEMLSYAIPVLCHDINKESSLAQQKISEPCKEIKPVLLADAIHKDGKCDFDVVNELPVSLRKKCI